MINIISKLIPKIYNKLPRRQAINEDLLMERGVIFNILLSIKCINVSIKSTFPLAFPAVYRV